MNIITNMVKYKCFISISDWLLLVDVTELRHPTRNTSLEYTGFISSPRSLNKLALISQITPCCISLYSQQALYMSQYTFHCIVNVLRIQTVNMKPERFL